MMFLHVLLFFWACPPTTAKGRLREFYVVQEKFTIVTDAVNKCRTHYTDLVTVYDREDDRKLSTILKDSEAVSGWIGAHLGNRSKKWSNGDEVTYKQDFELNCAETCCATMDYTGDWSRSQCEERKPFMCYEEDVGRASYKYKFIKENKSWFEAQLYCRENHTDLVSIRNQTETERVKKKLDNYKHPCWIGLLEDSVEWSDGGQSAYRNWGSDSVQSNKPEVFMTSTDSTKEWKKADKGEYHALCYKSFIHVSKEFKSWEDALDYCNNQHTTSGLLRIESEDDQIETERELRRQKISEPVWIGLRQSRLFGFWIWSNGISVGPWTNWKEGSAPEHQISQHCGALEKVNGTFKWTDKDCRSSFRVLCEGN